MPAFTARKYLSGRSNSVGALYRRQLTKHPFLLFGLPFIATIVGGSFLLTPATAVRYEKHDRKMRRLSQDEAMGLEKDRRRVDMNEEYYVCPAFFVCKAVYWGLIGSRNWLRRILIIGIRSGLRGSRGSLTVGCKLVLFAMNCSFPVPVPNIQYYGHTPLSVRRIINKNKTYFVNCKMK